MIVFGEKTKEASTAPFLIQTVEQEDNEIKFIIALPAYGEKCTDIESTDNPKLDEFLGKCVPIYADKNNVYEIVFEDYVFHMTRNESYTSLDRYEIRNGDYFILFEKSRLLDCLPHIVEKDLIEFYYPQGYRHYGIYCQNHIIDVIAVSEPKIKKYNMQER